MMKKIKAIILFVFMLAALTASGSLEAFITAVERFEENIMRSAPWDGPAREYKTKR